MSKVIRNTSKSPNPEWLMGGNPKAIENQEARGQQELCEASQLPKTDGCNDVRKQYEKLGIKVKGDIEGDEIWYAVVLPRGWKIKPTPHPMWSDLVDGEGKKIACLFYKAAFYDRSCHIHIL